MITDERRLTASPDHGLGEAGESAGVTAGRRHSMTSTKSHWLRNSFRIRKKRCLIEESAPSPTSTVDAVPLRTARRNSLPLLYPPHQPTAVVKKVRFGDKDEDGPLTTVIPNEIEPLSEEEMADYWYQQNDYMKFEKDRLLTSLAFVTARQRGNTKQMDEMAHSVRGLENLLDDRIRRRRATETRSVLKAVEENQRLVKPDKLSEIACKLTRNARDRAVQLAQEDARAVLVPSLDRRNSVTNVFRAAWTGFRR